MPTISMTAVAVLLVACGGGSTSSTKVEVECGATWATTPATSGTCDLACEEMMTGSGASCSTRINTGSGEIVCPSTFEVDSDRGCCVDIGMVGEVVAPNEPKRRRRVFFLSCAD